jgi:hypothetical protein
MVLPPCIRLADLRDLTDDELRAHIIGQYIEDHEDEPWAAGNDGYNPDATTPNVGTILVAYESVGDYGCDSSSYFLIERDGQLFENHGGHDSTSGFEGQWEPAPVTPAYLASKQWRMSTVGDDELEKQHERFIRSWLRHRFGNQDSARFKVPEFAIPTWALHVDGVKPPVDLRYADDDFIRSAVQRATNGLRVLRRWPDVRVGLVQSRNWIASRTNAVEQCRARGLLPTVEDLHVAADLASWRGHIDPQTGQPSPLAHTLVDLWVGFGKHSTN